MMDNEGDKARTLAEKGLAEQQAGDLQSADRSLQSALQIDPDAAIEVLQRTGADAAPDARDAAVDRDTTSQDGFRAPV